MSRALGDIAAREQDVLHAYAPGAVPLRDDVASFARLVPSMDPLSVAPPADCYFVIRDERGRQVFTRDGSFTVRDGSLVDGAGRPVLGYEPGKNQLGALHVDPIDAAFGFASSARIEPDGSVVYDRATVDPRSGKRELRRICIGRVALARFAAGTKLQMADAQHAYAPLGTFPHVGLPNDGNFAGLTPYAHAASGIDIDTGLERLQDAYVVFDAVRAAARARGSIDKTAMDLLK